MIYDPIPVSRDKVATIDLDQLQTEAERLVSLLKDRQPGLMTWNEMLRSRLIRIRQMLEPTK